MSERYQEFDQSDKAKTVMSWNNFVKNFQNVKPRRSEIILGVISIVAITVCIILAFVVSTTHKNVRTTSDKGVCSTMGCLRGAAFSLANMNSSINPCDDFYKFACGNFPKIVPLNSKTSSKTALDLINDANIDKIKKIISDPYSDDKDKTSMKGKIKDYYQSCTDDYQKEQRKGYPMIENVIPSLGGWYVLGNWSERTWDFQDVFLKASRDFSVLGFFRFIVTVDRYHSDKRVVEVNIIYFISNINRTYVL
ncbi:hypothetical protein FSP39_006512 [Pinctada imbricata]|uniref:Peptidase M13 N-terminal domain-containing protein n=1 Tax=Pinctada imbricata TaxID=66713 RepID=A0AA89C6S1_PINIB|nr:hypothetical protein FSP39_006512 [Pinctada imbricata]